MSALSVREGRAQLRIPLGPPPAAPLDVLQAEALVTGLQYDEIALRRYQRRLRMEEEDARDAERQARLLERHQAAKRALRDQRQLQRMVDEIFTA